MPNIHASSFVDSAPLHHHYASKCARPLWRRSSKSSIIILHMMCNSPPHISTHSQHACRLPRMFSAMPSTSSLSGPTARLSSTAPPGAPASLAMPRPQALQELASPGCLHAALKVPLGQGASRPDAASMWPAWGTTRERAGSDGLRDGAQRLSCLRMMHCKHSNHGISTRSIAQAC
jgi:hypothetical protein